jgi:hypothetical protein
VHFLEEMFLKRIKTVFFFTFLNKKRINFESKLTPVSCSDTIFVLRNVLHAVIHKEADHTAGFLKVKKLRVIRLTIVLRCQLNQTRF